MTTDLPIFSPLPQHIDPLLEALNNPAIPIESIAQAQQTTPRALIQWLNTPEITAIRDAFDAFHIRRARTYAAANLTCAVTVSARFIDDFINDPAPPKDAPLETRRLYARGRAIARNSCTVLLRLAGIPSPAPRDHTNPTTARPPHDAPSSTPHLNPDNDAGSSTAEHAQSTYAATHHDLAPTPALPRSAPSTDRPSRQPATPTATTRRHDTEPSPATPSINRHARHNSPTTTDTSIDIPLAPINTYTPPTDFSNDPGIIPLVPLSTQPHYANAIPRPRAPNSFAASSR